MTDLLERAEEKKHVLHIRGLVPPVPPVEWDPANPAEVATATEAFNTAQREGVPLAYTVPASGEQGEVIRDFDPEADEIIMTRQMAGG